jgi:hypothetical protein
MEIYEIFLVGIEVSIALAGFAGIITTFRMRNETTAGRGNVAGLTLLVQYSLLAAFACSIALILQTFGITGETLWASSSVCAALFTGYGAYGIQRGMRGVNFKKSIRMLYLTLQAIGALIAVANILNALGLVFHRVPGPFVVSVCFGLGVACFIFSRLLLMPLWRIVREKEGANSRATNPA